MRTAPNTRQQDYIKTYIRLKPILSSQNSLVACTENEVMVCKHNNDHFEYDEVFDDNCNNFRVFKTVMLPIVDRIFQGYNACILAYGQTSSGKTYTMKGLQSDMGLIPLTIRQIFAKIRDNKMVAKVSINYFEIYNENVIDLLSEQQNPVYLDLVTDKKTTIVQNLLNPEVKNEQQSMQFYSRGEARRKFASNNINFNSSRSHTIFRINLDVVHEDLSSSSATISMVDLAGSQSISKTNAVGQLKKQSQNINKSLLALSNVIRAIGDQNRGYINFRDSKLTRILQNCLVGNSKTVVVCTINQTEDCIGQTINTLKFGNIAKSIKTTAQRNIAYTAAKQRQQQNESQFQQLYTTLAEQRAQKAMLKDELARQRAKVQTYKEVQKTLTMQIDNLRHQLNLLLNENKMISIQYRQGPFENKVHRDKIALLQQTVKQRQYECSRLASTNRQLEERLYNARRENKQLEENQKVLMGKLAKYQSELSELQKSISSQVVGEMDQRSNCSKISKNSSNSNSNSNSNSKRSIVSNSNSGVRPMNIERDMNRDRERDRERGRDRLQPISEYPNGERPQFTVPFQDNPYTLGKVMKLSIQILGIKIQLNEYIKANAVLQEQNQKLSAKIDFLEHNGPVQEQQCTDVSQWSKPSRMSGKSAADWQYKRMKDQIKRLNADKTSLLKKLNQLRVTLKKNSDNYIEELTGFNRFIEKKFQGDQKAYFEFMFEEDPKDYEPIPRPN